MSAPDLGSLATALNPGMVVVTTAADGEQAGCLVGFHCQSGIEPQRYSVWLSKANHTYRVALRAAYLAVHFLTQDDKQLATLFGSQTGDEVDKFAGLACSRGAEQVPLLSACPNRIVLRRRTVLDDGSDHVCFSGDVEAGSAPGRFAPLRLDDVIGLEPGHDSDEPSRGA